MMVQGGLSSIERGLHFTTRVLNNDVSLLKRRGVEQTKTHKSLLKYIKKLHTSGSFTITSEGFSLPPSQSRVSWIARTGAHSGGALLKDPLYCSLLTVPYLTISLLVLCGTV